MDRFPDDENGNVLEDLASRGVDLSAPREVDFEHLFPTEAAALAFRGRAEALGYHVKVYAPDEAALEEGDSRWEACCTKRMIPSYESITSCESELASVARSLGGQEDGWGFLEA